MKLRPFNPMRRSLTLQTAPVLDKNGTPDPAKAHMVHVMETRRIMPKDLTAGTLLSYFNGEQLAFGLETGTTAVTVGKASYFTYKDSGLIVPGTLKHTGNAAGLHKFGFYGQTEHHQSGKFSHHQAGAVRGQFGAIPFEDWLSELHRRGCVAYEEAPWEPRIRALLKQCDTDAGAEMAAGELLKTVRANGREDMFVNGVSAHLMGQVLGDEPSTKTLQFCDPNGEAQKAYDTWRKAGNCPPASDPYYVPQNVAKLMHQEAQGDLIRLVRFVHFIGKLQGRKCNIPGFIGSAAHAFSHFFEFPPRPRDIKGHNIAEVLNVSWVLLFIRFEPFLSMCRLYGVTFDLEVHPGERAIGDLQSAMEFVLIGLLFGFGPDVIGFNFDPSHMVWQKVNPLQFLRIFWEYVHTVHFKGVRVEDGWCDYGVLGGHQEMNAGFGNWWDFVSFGCDGDAVPCEAIIALLNDLCFIGCFIIEWEDRRHVAMIVKANHDKFDDEDVQIAWQQMDGLQVGLNTLARVDIAPSLVRHDETLKSADATK